MDTDDSSQSNERQPFELTFEELVALIEEKGGQEEKEFAKAFLNLDEGSIDEKEIMNQLADIFSPMIGVEQYMLLVQLLHLKIGTETMKRLFEQTNSVFFLDVSFDTQLIAYMLSLGLEQEVYFKESKLFGRPLNFICRRTCGSKNWMDMLKAVPPHIIVEGMRLKDKVGNTMLHVVTPYNAFDPVDYSRFISYVELFEYLSTFEGYEDALLVTNNKGETPLLTAIDSCNCIETLELLIATPGGKAAATISNKKGKRPYDMLLEARIHYVNYSQHDNVGQRFEALLDSLEGLSKGLIKCARS